MLHAVVMPAVTFPRLICITFSMRGKSLGLRLATLHNLTFMQDLINGIRQAIMEDRYDVFAAKFLEDYRTTKAGHKTGDKSKSG